MDSTAKYVLEQSDSMLPKTWQPLENTSLEQVGELLRFTTPRDGEENYYRVVAVPAIPTVYYFEDFESGAEGWSTTSDGGDSVGIR